jgi:hypothetical protein
MYTVLQTQVGAEFKPVIKEIRYASPGWIELYLHLHPAVKIAGAVATIAASATGTVKAYASIQDLLYKIRARAKKAGIERIQLTRQEIQELHALNQELAKFIGFNSLDELEARSGRADVTAKLLSAQYRRLRALAEFVSKGKVKLPLPPPALPLPPLPPVNRR